MELKPICHGALCGWQVLIVPSGIETFINKSLCLSDFVLIVPSGIETEKGLVPAPVPLLVLIVPSGIETRLMQRKINQTRSINCT